MKVIYKDGRLNWEAVEYLRPLQKGLIEQLRLEYPWPREFFDDDLLFQFVTGELPPTTLAGALERGFGDLPWFIGWAYDRHDPQRKLTKWLRDGSLAEVVSNVRARVATMVELAPLAGRTEKDVNQLVQKNLKRVLDSRSRVLWNVFSENRRTLDRAGVTKAAWQARVIDSKMGSILALDTFLQVAKEYFRDNLVIGPQERALLNSDRGDMAHTGYMPYVDLFRCDGYAANLARKTASSLGTEIVSKLTLLPDAIEKRKAQQPA